MGSIPTARVSKVANVVKWLTHQIVALTFGGSIPAAPVFIINMAIVAKWLTHRIVAPALVGSIPIVRPCNYWGIAKR